MKFIETPLKGAYLIEVEKMVDSRGFFARAWCKNEMKNRNLNTDLVQSNFSFNNFEGTLRGMHFQKAPAEECKIVRCSKGSIFDVIIDLRPESNTYTKWFGIRLTQEDYNLLYVPEGFAHGYLTLQDNSEVDYMVTQFYSPEHDSGVRYNDPTFNIKWPKKIKFISDKDKNHPNYIKSDKPYVNN